MSVPPSTFRTSDPRCRLILALDFPAADPALALLSSLQDELRWVKVGLELFTAEGPSVVERLCAEGYRVFLDLKFHDIPATMAAATRRAASLGASLSTVHALAGEGVREAARAGAGCRPPLGVLAVTVLTSHAPGSLETLVESRLSTSGLAVRLAVEAVGKGAVGLVASPLEVSALRQAVGNEPLIVCPGIRPAGAIADDQARAPTPAAALQEGADFLVVGRPITRSADPAGALGRILDEMAAAV